MGSFLIFLKKNKNEKKNLGDNLKRIQTKTIFLKTITKQKKRGSSVLGIRMWSPTILLTQPTGLVGVLVFLPGYDRQVGAMHENFNKRKEKKRKENKKEKKRKEKKIKENKRKLKKIKENKRK